MNPTDFLRTLVNTEPLVQRLLMSSLELVILGVVIALVIQIARIRSPRLVYLLWLVVLIKPIVSLSAGSPLTIALFEIPVAYDTDLVEEETPLVMAQASSIPRDATIIPLAQETIPEEPNLGSVANLPEITDDIPSCHVATQLSLSRIIIVVWLIGVAVFLGFHLLARFRLHRLISTARPASGFVTSRYQAIASKFSLKRTPQLRITDSLESPALVGLHRPVILLPAWMADEIDQLKFDYAMRHELTHWRWLDPVAIAVRDMANIVFWFHPVMRWLGKRMVEAMELACDQATLGDPSQANEYAEQLLEILQRIRHQHQPAVAGGLFATRTQVGKRIAALLDSSFARVPQLTVTSVIGVAATTAIVFAMGLHVPASTAGVNSDVSSSIDADADGLENALEIKLGTSIHSSDTDGDGLSDYDEHCKYYTDPTKKDSDGDGKPDGDWQERREYVYTIRALCEIRSPSSLELINDFYQDARLVNQKASVPGGTVVEVLLFPFSAPHIYAQPYPRKSLPEELKQYTQPTVSMNYSPEMQKAISEIVKDATTDVEALNKMLNWFRDETKLARYNPHWDYLNVIDNEIIWHRSFDSAEQDERFLCKNFLGDSMFKNKVHGTCSSSAILRGAMFRAAGLPTRIVQTLPLISRYTGDPVPLAEKLRMRPIAKGYDWGPGRGGANHMYNEVFLNNRWIRVDDSIGVGPFVGDKLFVKAWGAASFNNIKEDWNEKRAFKALDISDAYPKYESDSVNMKVDVAATDLRIEELPDGKFKATVIIDNKSRVPSPQFKVEFYAGDPDKGGRDLSPSGYHNAGPIMPGGRWGEQDPRLELAPGEDTIVVVIDPDNKVDESDETNNKASKRVSMIRRAIKERPPKGTVYILGHIKRPGIYAIAEGQNLTLIQLIASAGGYDGTNNEHAVVTISREEEDGKRSVIRSIMLNDLLKDLNIDFCLSDGDNVLLSERQ